jgi:hypothetical protein
VVLLGTKSDCFKNDGIMNDEIAEKGKSLLGLIGASKFFACSSLNKVNIFFSSYYLVSRFCFFFIIILIGKNNRNI